jgi:hypothetical protein
VDYSTAFTWGIEAGVHPLSWLAVRVYTRFANMPVEVKPGGFDTELTQYPDTEFSQKDLDLFGLGARIEPGLRLAGTLRGFAIIDIGWSRFVAAAPEAHGAKEVVSFERAGVGVHYRGGLGISFEPVEDWVLLSARGSYGWVASQSGTAFKNVLQGIDETGNIVHIAALPRFGSSLELLASVGLIL